MYPPPLLKCSLLDPSTPRKFRDPPLGGGGGWVWIFSGTTHWDQGLGKGYQLKPSASDHNPYQDLNYSGYHKNLVQ